MAILFVSRQHVFLVRPWDAFLSTVIVVAIIITHAIDSRRHVYSPQRGWDLEGFSNVQ
jgi:hypothetical protein